MSVHEAEFLRMWDESWTTNGWVVAWPHALEGLTPAQAAWQPAPGRHSIWQNINHVCIWREYTLTKVDGRPGPPATDMEHRNFEQPETIDEAAWALTQARLKKTHDDLRALLATPGAGEAKMRQRLYAHLHHDAYHLGQIMQLRGLQGFKSVY